MGDKIGDTVAAIEMDEGAERPLGMGYDGVAAMKAGAPLDIDTLEAGERASFAALQDIVSLLGPIGANSVLRGGGGSDIAPLVADGVPSLSPRTTVEHYFDWHHTEADTLDKVDPVEFRKNAAMLSVVTFVLADMDGRLTGKKGAGEE